MAGKWREQKGEGANQADVPNVFLPRAAGSLIGEGITNFITDWDKISATVSSVCVCVCVCVRACMQLIETTNLKMIKANYRKVGDCMIETISQWLYGVT